MRVLHVVGNLDADAGGSTSAAFHVCGYLLAHGVDAQLAGTWEGPGAAEYITEQWPELVVHGFERRAPRHYWHSPSLRRWLWQHARSFDLLVVNGLFKFPFVDAARAARRAAVPYLVQPHGSLDPYDLRKHRVAKRVYGPLVARPLLSWSAGAIVTSERERTQLVTYGADVDVHVVPLPVAALVRPGDGERFRRSIGVSPEAPLVLFLSRIDQKKGLERLLHALRAIVSSRPTLKLVIVGGVEDRRYAERLEALAAELGVTSSLIWAGLRIGESKWDAFASADVFTLPSDYENFGIVVIEALLAERPVVISDGVYIASDLADEGVADVCGQDVPSLVAALERVLSDKNRAEAMARRGRQAVQARFAPEAATAAVMDVYRAAHARGRAPSAGDN